MLDETNAENENEEWKMVERKKKKARKQIPQAVMSAGETNYPIGQKSRDMGEDQSEEDMETEGEGDTPATVDCNKEVQSVSSNVIQQTKITNNNMTTNNEPRKREAYVREDGVLKHISEIDVSKVSSRLEFEENFGSNYKVTLRIMERTGTAKKEANRAIKKINEDKEKEGYRAGIEDRDTYFKGVVPLYLDTIMDFYDLLTYLEDIVRIERMMRRRWNKEENKVEFEPVDSVIITFKGNQPREKISFFNDLACFRYGHRKIHCKSEECCINCGEKAHGHCNEPTKCRNCGEGHKSTDRKCEVYDRNQRIKKVMAYNNASYKEALEILEGSEENPTEIYDRYEKPNNWPLINKSGQKTNQRQKPLYRDKVIGKGNIRKGKEGEGDGRYSEDTSSDDLTYQSLDNSGSIRQIRKRDVARRRTQIPVTRTNYYSQRGIALTSNPISSEHEGNPSGKTLTTEKEKRKEIITRLLVAVEKDWDLEPFLEQVLDELRRVKGGEGVQSNREQDKEQHRKDIIQDKNRMYREERRNREKRIVEKMIQDFGKDIE
ncbi:hypothetical protein P5V15_001434 [Pogonomyrmex californicus]